MVGEVEHRELIELRDHLEPAVTARGLDVLAEGVAVAHRGRTRDRREELRARERVTEGRGEIGRALHRGANRRHRDVLALDHPEEIGAILRGDRVGGRALEVSERCVEVEDLVVDDGAMPGAAALGEGHELHAVGVLRSDARGKVSSKLAPVRPLLLLPFVLAIGCGTGGMEVVRVHNGRQHPGRFVSSTAYAASLEASLAEQRGDWPRAIEHLERARREDPDGPELAARLGLALCHAGDAKAGLAHIEQALSDDPALERGYTARARCRLLHEKSDAAIDRARADLIRALSIDPDALDPALLLVELDLTSNNLARARVRAEETAVLHPKSARALRAVAEVAARQGDAERAMSAALSAAALDEATGAIAKSVAADVVDRSGVAAYALALRGVANGATRSVASEGECTVKLRAFEEIAARADAAAVTTASDALQSACPELEAHVAYVEATATWTPKTAEEVEARALSAPSAAARRFAARMRLRRRSIEELLEPNSLPRAEDRATLAVHLAASALRTAAKAPDAALALAAAAHDLSPAEPTVARLSAEAARRVGKPDNHPLRRVACTLARTNIEKLGC